MRFSLFALALLALAAACAENTSFSASVEESTERALTMSSASHGLLPAFALPGERKRPGAKADQFDDWRDAYPEWYAITVPPAVPGFRAMVEWEPMSGTILTYADYLAEDPDVRQTMIDIAAAALSAADLHVIYNSAAMRTDFIDRLRAGGLTSAFINEHVVFHNLPNDSIWLIDYGPLPLVDPTAGSVAFLDWRYYHERNHDDGVPTQLGRALGVTTYRQPLDLEGGNLQADGEGACFTTQRALEFGGPLAQMETGLAQYAGCDELVVLRDIHNDATGHIDMFFKLVSPTEVLLGEFTTQQDAVAQADMDWNAELLGARGLTVYRMPMPDAVEDPWYGPIPRTYLNSTLIDGPRGKVNLWPVYEDDEVGQAAALAIWQQVMPDWEHRVLASDVMASYSGTIHCVTRTLPDLAFSPWVAAGECVGGVCAPPEGGYAGECIDSDDCWGPAWVCPTNDCIPCQSAADCDDGDPCTVDGCDVGCFWTPVDCPEGQVCLGGDCVEQGAKTCESPFVLSCGDSLSDDTASGANNSESYSCVGWLERGPEHVFQITLDAIRPLTITLTGLVADIDLFLLEGSCDGQRCVAVSAGETDSERIDGFMASPGVPYYVVLDGYEGASSPYTLSVDCGEACSPDCRSRQCGPDPVCGVDCGACPDGDLCNEGLCIADPCTSLPFEGCCDGALLSWCDDEGFHTIDCGLNEAPANGCGWLAEAAYFDCGGVDPLPAGMVLECPWAVPCAVDADCDDGKACTADRCEDGRCAWAPIPGCCEDAGDCNDRDPCTTDACTANECVHAPIAGCVCSAALCDDGNVCTTDSCNAQGLCRNLPVSGCCLDADDCDDGDACTADACVGNACVHENDPDCVGCVEDAQCDDGNVCTIDYCDPQALCQHGPIRNCCNVAADCDDGNACHVGHCQGNDCTFTDLVCGAGEVCNPATGCETACVPECSNKECGPNGCGGFCGQCAEGWDCNERGRCFQSCDCTGMQCGAPSAGCPECGTCAAGELCNEMFQCVPDGNYVPDAGGGDGDVVAGPDVGAGGGSGGGGCTTGASAPASLPLALLAFAFLAVLRRRARV